MKVKLKRMNTVNVSKLACVKKIKELTGLGLKESKDITDISEVREAEFEIINFEESYIILRNTFELYGYILTNCRYEALDELLGDGIEYVFEYLNRDITYKIISGKYEVDGVFYHINVETGIKCVNGVDSNINNKEITIPMKEVSFERTLDIEL